MSTVFILIVIGVALPSHPALPKMLLNGDIPVFVATESFFSEEYCRLKLQELKKTAKQEHHLELVYTDCFVTEIYLTPDAGKDGRSIYRF